MSVKTLVVLVVTVSLALILIQAYGYLPVHPEVFAIPHYVVRTLLRMSVAYFLALAFGVFCAVLIELRRGALKFMLPILDVLQSVPVLGFFPIAILASTAVFPGELGVEIASIVLIFTSMAWSIAFGAISGVLSMPEDIRNVSKAYRVRGFNYIRNIVLPAIYPSLISSSIIAWGSGWYFLVICEYISFGPETKTLPGLGYLIANSAYTGNISLALTGLIVLAFVVLVIDRLIWDPLLSKSERFRYEVVTTRPTFYLAVTKKSLFERVSAVLIAFPLSLALILLIQTVYAYSTETIDPLNTFLLAIFSLCRIFIAYLLALAWTLAVALWISRSQRLLNIFMPVFDIAQSIPATAFFPFIVVLVIGALPGIGQEVAAILLLMTGMQWYLLFNIIGALRSIPGDLLELAKAYGIKGRVELAHILLPSAMPGIVSGSILAFGGGWNALIIAEYINYGGKIYKLDGIGRLLDEAAWELGDMGLLVLITAFMTAFIVLINKLVWTPLFKRIEKYRFG